MVFCEAKKYTHVFSESDRSKHKKFIFRTKIALCSRSLDIILPRSLKITEFKYFFFLFQLTILFLSVYGL